ncbi:MAG: hypothetical protein HY597_02265 [Candidatus Omnitrophica bacterium]|nr:hypothetical protein [Candidatus Omnitrophota bacterium]
MTLKRFFAILFTVTLGALAYTHQQLHLVRLSYALDERYDQWQIAAQRQSYLRTQVLALASPQSLDRHLSQAQVRLAFRGPTHVVHLAAVPAMSSTASQPAWLALTTEAEASTDAAAHVDPGDLQD